MRFQIGGAKHDTFAFTGKRFKLLPGAGAAPIQDTDEVEGDEDPYEDEGRGGGRRDPQELRGG